MPTTTTTQTTTTPTTEITMSEATNHYVEPGWFTRNVFNRSIAFLTRHGVSIWGSRELRVRGRKTGEWRSTPVNLLTIDGTEYLVAPRGETQWVRNIRVAGGGELRVGRRVEAFTIAEVDGEAKVEILRAYLRRLHRRGDRRHRPQAPGVPDHPSRLTTDRIGSPNATHGSRSDYQFGSRGGQARPCGLGSRSSNSGSRCSALAVKVSIMSAGWNMPVCQVAM